MTQTPATGSFILKWRGDALKVTLTLDSPRRGRASFRTNLGRAAVRRDEIIAETERGETPLARAWTDIALEEVSPGVFSAEIQLSEVGIFSGKACFFPEGSNIPEWPSGSNTHIKVESAETRSACSIYTVFPRQFGSFREVARRLPVIMDEMGFRIIQTLPPFPVPTTYAVMGEYGCPFASLDFLSVDPAMAEFDESATPLDQFRELIDAVHARRGLFFVDLPANHTGWASTLQTHHPDWFRHESDGRFHSPGAWGVKWADLVELDYSNGELRAYMADVFLFWCRNGVDGFRCDAGYMIPIDTWTYIVARVRDEYPDTVFMLEGLGGRLETTDALLAEANLDWAYSEIFQTYDRRGFEWYLPQAIARSERHGTLVHFAETHDNDRLAKRGETYARLRVQLAALLSWQGAWGIANGVEWYCREKIDVHGKNDLNWGSANNMVALISRLNRLLATMPAFSGSSHLEVVTEGEGNTLAVARDGLLVLANLDCSAPARIQWRRSSFNVTRAVDLLTERFVNTASGVALKPGEVMCLFPAPTEDDRAIAGGVEFGIRNAVHYSTPPKCDYHWRYPQDLSRTVCVPEGALVEISAPTHFRGHLVDPATGKTLRVYRSREKRSGGKLPHYIYFDAPHYVGDGTCSRALELKLVVYGPFGAERTTSRFLVPPRPDDAKVKVALDANEIRSAPLMRTVLSNGAGAASQMRVGWGEIASQYDAILAANPNPDVPSDRLVVWTRLRCWLQREGYTRAFDARCQSRVVSDPAGRAAKWVFRVPCGMGRETSFSFTLSLGAGENVARLRVRRDDIGPNDVRDSVRLVFRPDIEWRSFHATTKAFQGLEHKFPAAVTANAGGFSFHPYEGSFEMTVTGGEFHGESEWQYSVSHAEEAERGQDGSGDLFSPGWISADLEIGGVVDIEGRYLRKGEAKPKRESVYALENFTAARTLSIGKAMRDALELYIVKRDNLKTVIAGYPWFLDWGRDTFIFMRGMIAAGMITDSVKILRAFAAFEERGTLPNIIYGDKAGNRDTTDAQLWFVRCVEEVERASGRVDEKLRETCASIVRNYIAGTANGIHVDRDSFLVWSPSHFTWMDTNYPACTPRVGYPVEIQALWHSALRFLGMNDEADKVRDSIVRYFKWEHGYRDCLAAPRGERAADSRGEDTIRPNQLFLVTLGVISDKSILEATEELLVPGGIRSLNAEHPLYRGRYTGDEDTSRKRAYHNGTVWAWPFPLYAEALVATGMATNESARALLASAVESLNSGCLCHMCEIADGDSPHTQKGCTAQAWSVSEVLRVWLKLGGK